jgi:hypothetical protein
LKEIKSSLQDGEKYRTNPWILPPDPLLHSLSQKNSISFAPFILPRVLIWSPHFYLPESSMPCCPNCYAVVKLNGWAPPRPVVDIEDRFFLIARSYVCGCKHSYTSSQPEFIAKLPREVSVAFPVQLSKRNALSKTLVDMLLALDEKGMGPSSLRSMILELHTLRFDSRKLQYYGFAVSRKEYRDKHGSLDPVVGDDVPHFPEFDEVAVVPSSSYFKDALIKYCSSLRDYWDYSIHRRDSTVVKADHTFKVKQNTILF